MRTGVGYPSYLADVTWTSEGTWNANYPAVNAGVLNKPTQVARAPGNANIAVRGTFSAARMVGFFALVNHNLPAGATFQVQGYSNTTPDGSATAKVYDSGVIQVWPTGGPVLTYTSVRPLVLPTPTSIRSFRIAIFPTSPNQVLELGGIEVSGWWEWDGISSRDFGVASRDEDIELVGGASSTSRTWSPRILNGQLDYMKVGSKTETVQDFQREADLTLPFVFSLDVDAPATWPRTTFLAKNQELPPLVGALYRHDAFNFRFTEHWR
jgi:hypothetical protein